MRNTTDQKADFRALNAILNLPQADGTINFDADRKAAREYFLQHVNQNTTFFHSLQEKLEYLITEGYYDETVLNQYSNDFVTKAFEFAYSKKFRFKTFVGAFKYYTGYTLKTRDGSRYLERFEDRVVMTALTLARGSEETAMQLVDEIISGRFQPATPTFLNAGKLQRGELVSCFLLRVEDNMESIGRNVTSALQLSKRGGGVALLLSNLRETGAPIKGISGQASGVVPVMKILEDSFSYADQLGQRQGAGAVYLHAHHPDIMAFLDTKRENADEKIRIKTLSLGVSIPDITFELARRNEDMYLFSPYDVERVYGKPFSDISVTELYYQMVDDERIRKTKINPRRFFQTLAEIEFESGYPYILFEDNANKGNPIDGRINMSNLCTEILQVNSPSTLRPDTSYEVIGDDISCNLGSINIAAVMDNGNMARTVNTAIRALTAVSDMTDLVAVPSIRQGNNDSHAVGLGQMNLHGYLARERIHYDSPEAVEFVSVYFAATTYHCIQASCQIAQERQQTFVGFEKSKYASGEYFDKYTNEDWLPVSDTVKALFAKSGTALPTREDWQLLKQDVMRHGMYNRNLQAVAPTGSISYVNNATASITPITSMIEIRKEGKTGRMYYPAPYLSNDNKQFYKDAYQYGPNAIIDIYAAAGEHVDQGLSLTLFFPDTATTRDINKAQIYAWTKGIKTIYYVRIRQEALEGTEVKICESCQV